MELNWLFIAVVIVMLCCAYYGYKKGIVRIVFSIGSLIIAIALASILTPYINQYLRYNTTLYTNIEEKCIELLSKSDEQGNDPQNDEGSSLDDESVTTEDGQAQQTEVQSILDEQQLPTSLKDSIEKMSLSVEEQAHSAQTAVAGSIADMALSAICFVATLLIIRIVLMILSRVLNIITKLPIIHGLNQFAGLVFGLAEGLLIVWIFFIFLTCILQTEFGQSCVEMIVENEVLTYLFDHNLLMLIFHL